MAAVGGGSGEGDVGDEDGEEESPRKKAVNESEWRVPGKRSHPFYKKLSALNGEVNSMSLHSVRQRLAKLGLCDRGSQDVLYKRLKQHQREQAILSAGCYLPPEILRTTHHNPYGLEYLLVLDFEATCEEVNPVDYIHEIIEFPAVAVDLKTLENVYEFHSYCKPWLNPRLSEFCVKLTGISQSQVDSAPNFPQVLKMFTQWLTTNNLRAEKFCIVTDCPWDIRDCLFPQCVLSSCRFPTYAHKWIDVRKLFASFYHTHSGNLSAMLEKLGMEFEGRPHCGLDDARNISRIVRQLIKDGCTLQYNRFIPQDALQQLPRHFR